MESREATELFSIPDFWKRSTWQQELNLPLAPPETQDGFFNLKIGDHDEVSLFLGGEETPGDGEEGSFFKIPALLRQSQPANPNDDSAIIEPARSAPAADNGNDEDNDNDDDNDDAGVDEDLWLYPDEHRPPSLPEYKSWEAFEHSETCCLVPLFASEQGPDFVDALVVAADNPLGLEEAPGGDSLVVEPRGYCNCLLALALGRSSVLFSWNDSKRSFFALQQSLRIPGFTGPVLRSVEETCLECGTYSRFLRAFVDLSFTSASSATPSRAALARAVDRMLLAIQSELGVRGQKARSVLQLQALIRPVAAVVRYMRGLVVKLSRFSADDGLLLTALFQEAESMEHGAALLREVAKQVLQIVSEPWLGFVGEWIGMDPKSKSIMWSGKIDESRAFVRFGDRVWIDDAGAELVEADYFLDQDKMPAFIPDEMARALFETGRNLRFLWTNHPEHALSDPATFARAGPPSLRWRFDWEPILEAERVAQAYEQAVAETIATHRSGPEREQGPSSTSWQFQLSEALQPRSFDIGWRLPSLELQLLGKDIVEDADDRLATILRQRLFDDVVPICSSNGHDKHDRHGDDNERLVLDEFSPHWSLLPLLSFGPVISAQARLVSRECMRLLFSAHDVREHLRLQREFQLLGNGGFCSRLSHALFDPDLAGAEAKKGVQLSSGGLGLRLLNRESWPPASSELRLALMGVLAESYDGQSQNQNQAQAGKQAAGAMSFAVRDLSPEEMDRCMDADTLEALDFLRLSYKPPSALMSVITPAILAKYDRIFKLLLRVLRMYYAVNHLSQGSFVFVRLANKTGGDGGDDNVTARFRFEAHHFVANVMAYFMDIGVGTPWQAFDLWLDDVQDGLGVGGEEGSSDEDKNGDEDVTMTTTTTTKMLGRRLDEYTVSPDRLRERHEQTVDEIMSALFLRKRQQPLLELLQSIFGMILDFAKLSRGRATALAVAQQMDDEAERQAGEALLQQTTRLYLGFRKKVAVFLTVCRGLSEKEANSAARRAQQRGGENSSSSASSSLSGLLLMLDYNGFFSGSPVR